MSSIMRIVNWKTDGPTGRDTATISFVVPAGYKNRVLIVQTHSRSQGGVQPDVVTITYNGKTGTEIRSENTSTPNISTHVWRVMQPDEGDNNVFIDMTNSHNYGVGIILLVNGDQTSPVVDHDGLNGSGPLQSFTITSEDNGHSMDAVTVRTGEGFGTGSDIELYKVEGGLGVDLACQFQRATSPNDIMSWPGDAGFQGYAQIAVSYRNRLPVDLVRELEFKT